MDYHHNILVEDHLDQLGKGMAAGILEIRYFGHMAGIAVAVADLVVGKCSGHRGTDAPHMGLLVVVDCKDYIVETVHTACPMVVGHKHIHPK